MKNRINNEELDKVNGGITNMTELYVNICDGTVVSGSPSQGMVNGLSFTSYEVHGDNGQNYYCIWLPSYAPTPGMRVRIKRAQTLPFKGYYVADPI